MKINHAMGQALHRYGMIQEGDRILVAVSGGKDSLCMLHFLEEFRRKAPVSFELLAFHLDQAQPGYPDRIMPELFADWGIPHRIERVDTYSIVQEKVEKGKTTCSLCSRLRRGILYRVACEEGCNKLALGHHRDDVLQTFLLNAFFSGKLGSMPPIYRSREEVVVIRPLIEVAEVDLAQFASEQGWPIVPCNLCGSQEGLKRQAMETLLSDLETRYPQVRQSLFRALGNPHLEELLDKELWARPEMARSALD